MRSNWLGVLAVLLVAYSAQAVNVNYIGSGSGNNFSVTGNWSAYPAASGDTFYIGVTNNTAVNRAKINITNTFSQARIHSQTGYGTGTSYAEVLSGTTLKASTTYIGNPANLNFDGSLILRSGAGMDTMAPNSGAMYVGGETSGMVGELFVEAGAALFRQNNIQLGTYGRMQFIFGANSVSTLSTIGTNAVDNTLNGLLQVDLAALTATTGTYTLIDSTNSNRLIKGSLYTWLNGVGGSYTNTGSYSNSNFQVLSGGTKQWSIALADGGKDLTLTVIPEPTTISLFVVAGLGAFVMRRMAR